MKLRDWLICLVIIVLVLPCIGFALPADLFLNSLFGWIVFLGDALPKVQVNGPGVATGLVCLALFAAGSHAFLRWLLGAMTGTRWAWRWTGSLVAGVVLMFVAGLATAGVAHQVGWLMTSKEPWISTGSGYAIGRIQSTNNLKQIGLALHNYHDAHGTFPPGATFDRLGRPLHGWMMRIFPFLEANQASGHIDDKVPWDDPVNEWICRSSLSVYLNPGLRDDRDRDERGLALSHYAGNVHVLGPGRTWKLDEIKDGTSNTFIAGEAAGNFRPWGDPTNWRDPALGINKSADGFGSPFPGGANVLFADGSVRFIKDTVAPRVFKALGTPDGGEKVGEDEY